MRSRVVTALPTVLGLSVNGLILEHRPPVNHALLTVGTHVLGQNERNDLQTTVSTQ